MPTVEITSWTPSEAYLANPSMLTPTLDFLKSVDGCKDIYSGLAEDDSPGPNKALFLTIVWESYRHHKALIDNPPQNISLGPAIKGDFSMYHVNFVNDSDVYASLSAPVTEVLATTLQEGKTKEDFEEAYVGNVIQQTSDVAVPKLEHASATWGQTVEDERKFYVLAGWDSIEKGKENDALRAALTELGNTKINYVKLVRYA